MPEENAASCLPRRWTVLVPKAQPFESVPHGIIKSVIFKAVEILAHDEEGNKEYQRLARLPIEVHTCSVDNKEEHESKISEVIQILSSIEEQTYQYKSLNVLQKEKQEFVDG